MRIWTALLASVAAPVLALGLTPVANAQSVIQKIFGIGAPPNAVPMAAQRPRFVMPPRRFQSRPIEVRHQSRARPTNDDDELIGPPDSGGPYKTVCVRACDGFYFPLRHNARRKNFASDVKSCRNACGSDARLYYYPLNGADGPDTMVDLSGRKYSEQPKAFVYRRSRVEGCACKPDPWSYEEAQRHQSYADQEAIELAKDEAFVKAREAEVKAAKADTKTQDVAAAEIAKPVPEPAVPAADGSIDMTAAVQVALAPETGEPVSDGRSEADHVPAKSEPVIVPRAPRRRARSYVQRATFKPTAAPAFGKSKFVWPGDAR